MVSNGTIAVSCRNRQLPFLLLLLMLNEHRITWHFVLYRADMWAAGRILMKHPHRKCRTLINTIIDVKASLWASVWFAHHTFQHMYYTLISAWHCQEKPTDPNSVVMFFRLVRGCRCVWELHPCSTSGLWAVVCSVCVPYFYFPPLTPLISLTVASLQGVAQDFMLSCNHHLTLSLFCYFSVWLKSPAASAALQPAPLPLPVSLCCGSASLSFSFSYYYFWGDPLSLSSVPWLAFFLIVRHPPPLCSPCALPWFSAAPVYSSVIGQWVSVLFVCSCVS